MKWIDRWFFRKWQWAWENRDQPDLVVAVQSSTAINKPDEQDFNTELGKIITLESMRQNA